MMRFAKAQLNPPSGHARRRNRVGLETTYRGGRIRSCDGAGLDDCGRWSDPLAQRPDRRITFGNLHQSRVQVRGHCVVQHGRNQRSRSTGDISCCRKAAGRDVKLEGSETSDPKSDKLAIDAKLRRRLVGRYQLTAGFYFHRSRRGWAPHGWYHESTDPGGLPRLPHPLVLPWGRRHAGIQTAETPVPPGAWFSIKMASSRPARRIK